MQENMADDQQFCLRWNNFQTNFTSQFKALRIDEDFVDVTLACEGKRIKAHKLVLSACSPYFKELFKGNPCKHPIIFMQDVEYEHLINLVEFMYEGQVNICQTKLPSFLHTAESLHIRGLSAQSQNKLPQNSDHKSGELRPGPSLRDSPNLDSRSHGSSPEHVAEDEDREDGGLIPLASAKRLCVMPGIEPNSHLSHESTSYNDLPTTALIETKMEPMDYYSDGEVKPNTSHNSNTDHSLSRSGYTLQGALDAAANMSAQITQLQEASQEQMQDVGEMCKPHSPETQVPVSAPPTVPAPAPSSDPFKPHSLDPRPCPECGRIYSNISNLRQHIRLIHYPECITCPLCFKPFKNKLYLRRHVMSYHEVNLPNQNDRRYKYANVLNNSVPVFTSKSEAPEGFYSRKLAGNTISMYTSSKMDSVGSMLEKKFGFAEVNKKVTGRKGLTESNVPSST